MGERTLVLTPFAVCNLVKLLSDGTVPADLKPGERLPYTSMPPDNRVYIQLASDAWGPPPPRAVQRQVFWTPYLKMVAPPNQPYARQVLRNMVETADYMRNYSGPATDSQTASMKALAEWLAKQAVMLGHDLAFHQSDVVPEHWHPFGEHGGRFDSGAFK